MPAGAEHPASAPRAPLANAAPSGRAASAQLLVSPRAACMDPKVTGGPRGNGCPLHQVPASAAAGKRPAVEYSAWEPPGSRLRRRTDGPVPRPARPSSALTGPFPRCASQQPAPQVPPPLLKLRRGPRQGVSSPPLSGTWRVLIPNSKRNMTRRHQVTASKR